MKLLLFLFALVGQADNTMYIVLDGSPQCKILKTELTRDWLSGRRVNDTCYALANKQLELSKKIVIVDSTNPNERHEHGVPHLYDLPKYRIGKYKEFYQFPTEMFTASSYPLLGTIALQHNAIAMSAKDWKEKCAELKYDADCAYSEQILIWGVIKDVKEAKGFSAIINGKLVAIPNEVYIGMLKNILAGHGNEKDFPVRVQPIYPEYPIMRLPWETQAEFDKQKDLALTIDFEDF